MNKSLTVLMAAALACAASLARAETRHIPDDARRAEVAPIDVSHLAVWGRAVRLSAGTRILDRNNRYITPSAVPADSVARLRVNADSSVRDVWLLTDGEIAAGDPQPAWPKP